MQVSVETTQGLERRMTVQVPAEKIENEVGERLRSLTKTAKIAGFRPGKVPPRVIKSKFGSKVRQDVVSEVLQESLIDAVRQEKLHLAADPTIEDLELDAGKDLQYVAIFEVYPEVTIAPLEDIQAVRPVVAVDSAKVDEVIENLRNQQVSWETVERGAANKDRVSVNFSGTIDGEAFDGNEGKDVSIIMGSNMMIPGFEEKLIDCKAGESVVLDLAFPEGYQQENLAGKPVQFQVEMLSVFEPKLPDIDETFIKNLGIEGGTEEALRTEITKNLAKEIDQLVKSNLKDQIIKSLLALHQIDLPKQLITSESENIKKQNPDLSEDQVEKQAHERVTLGLVFAKILETNKFETNHERVREMVEMMASRYDHAEQMVEWYYEDKSRLAVIERIVMEEQIVDWVLEQAHVSEENMTFDDLYKS